MKNEVNKLGLVIADSNEIHEIPEFKFIEKIDGKFSVDLYEFKNKQIFVINSRIGLVNAAIATQHLIDKFNVNQIWNYGAVGSTGKCKLYDVVIPQKFYFYDAITPWYKRGQTPGEKEYFLNSLIDKNKFNIGSGNSFIEDVEYINDLLKELDIHIIDMESCAIAQVCDRNGVDFFCVKAVSDVIGQNVIDKNKINDSISKASKLALKKMIEIIKIK